MAHILSEARYYQWTILKIFISICLLSNENSRASFWPFVLLLGLYTPSVWKSNQGPCQKPPLMPSVPVDRQEPSDAQDFAQNASSQSQRHSVCVAKAHYQTAPSEPFRTGDVMAVIGGDGKSSTTLLYEGIEYSNAQEWLTKVFNNSGKSCFVQFERPQAAGTPRPTRYVPPTARCQFGRFV
jgi:hypothetical protein